MKIIAHQLDTFATGIFGSNEEGFAYFAEHLPPVFREALSVHAGTESAAG